MPYTLVEIMDLVGDKELLAAPATWIQRQEDGATYLYWPCVRNIRKLTALFEDEYSTPSEIWERYECEILCKNIPSLASADKIIETMEMEYNESKAIPSKGAAPVGQQNLRVRPELQTNRPQPETKHRTNDNVQKLLSCINKQIAESDPLGDVKPCPQLLDLMNELKCMIQSNQEEITKKLKEGFGHVEKSLIAQQMESNAMQFAMERMESSVVAKIPAFDRTEKFKVDVLCDVEELEKFEERLNDDEYLKKVCGWIDTSLGLVRESEHRMHIILDHIFDRKLFATFSWTGAGNNKRALNVHKNILGLFEYAGTTPMQRIDHIAVERFIRKKLHNSGTRALMKGVRKSVPHSRKRLRRPMPSAVPVKYATSNAKPQKMPSTTNVRVITRQQEQRGQSSSSSTSTSSSSSPSASSYSARDAATDNLSGAECIVIKEDPAAYIDVMDDYEDMLGYNRLQM